MAIETEKRRDFLLMNVNDVYNMYIYSIYIYIHIPYIYSIYIYIVHRYIYIYIYKPGKIGKYLRLNKQ